MGQWIDAQGNEVLSDTEGSSYEGDYWYVPDFVEKAFEPRDEASDTNGILPGGVDSDHDGISDKKEGGGKLLDSVWAIVTGGAAGATAGTILGTSAAIYCGGALLGIFPSPRDIYTGKGSK